MNSWSRTPFVRIIIPFVAGILIYRAGWEWVNTSVLTSFVVALITATGLWILAFPRLQDYSTRRIQGISLLVIILIGGYLQAYVSDSRNHPDFLGKQLSGNAETVIFRINNEVEQHGLTFKTTGKALAVWKNGEWKRSSGNILIYMNTLDSMNIPEYGDLVAGNFCPRMPDPPLFNSDFNYRKYLSDKNIHLQGYIPYDHWEILDKARGNPLIAFAIETRNSMVGSLKNHLGSGDEYAVVTAMLTGYRADISADMMQSYSKAGVIHIMSVSGLHVGIIYLMIAAFLRLFRRLNKKIVLRAGLILLIIWFYALLTGLSASVLRSAVMISFIVIGESIRRKINPFNSLCAAAFVLLLVEPASIGEPGFQLSFAAVAGIFMWYSWINNALYFRSRLFTKIWSLASVSLSAQLATLPLILYHFGQFPVYFLITNIVIVPLSGLVIYAGMATLAFAWIPVAGDAISWLTVSLTKLMNRLVSEAEKLPGAVAGPLYISEITALLMGLLLLLLYFVFRDKNSRLLLPALSVACLITISHWQSNQADPAFCFVLKDGRQYIGGAQVAGTLYIIEPEQLNSNPSAFVLNRLSKYAERNRLFIKLVSSDFDDGAVFRNKNVIAFGSRTIFMWDKRYLPPLPARNNPIDAVFAPNLSSFQQKKYMILAPPWTLLSKSSTPQSTFIDLNRHKDWWFRIDY